MPTSSTGLKPKPAPTLRFDADEHRYWLDGRELPSVTTVLKSVGIIDPSKYAGGDAALRGTYVHEALSMVDLDTAALDERLRGFVAAWRLFIHQNNVEVLSTEKRVYSRFHGYAGTRDCLVVFHGTCWVLDIKTGGRERWHGLQTMAYYKCEDSPYKGFYKRAAIYLNPDGTYRLDVHDNPDDWDAFLSALNIHKWKGKR